MLVNTLKYTILWRFKFTKFMFPIHSDYKDNYTEKGQINYFALIQNLHNTQKNKMVKRKSVSQL